jgi:SAM-dependent methyltransferase
MMPPIFRSMMVGAPRLLARLYAINEFLGEITPPRSILEIGPGLGDLADHLLKRFPNSRIQLSEISADAAKILVSRFENESRITVSQEDVLFGERSSKRFDLIIACEVFEHIQDDVTGFHAVSSLLEANGYFIFSAPCHMRKWQAADVFAGHYRRYERAELTGKLQNANLEVIHLWTFGYPTVNIIQPLRELYYRARNRSATMDKQAATKKSGIDRPAWMRRAKWIVIAAMLPLLPLERRYWNSERGDGYLVLARKR